MAGKRRSIHVEGVHHGAPIPMGALVGNVLFSSGIIGIDPATGTPPDDLESQCEFAFHHGLDVGPVEAGSGKQALAEALPRRKQPSGPARHRIRRLPTGGAGTTGDYRGVGLGDFLSPATGYLLSKWLRGSLAPTIFIK